MHCKEYMDQSFSYKYYLLIIIVKDNTYLFEFSRCSCCLLVVNIELAGVYVSF